MKRWQETTQILDRLEQLHAEGRDAALAVVVQISGSSYRRPGAKFLVEEDGSTLGSVSGGCLEGDVREHAKQVMAEGTPRLLHYETGGDEETVWGFGLGCNGEIDVLVHSLTGDGTEEDRVWGTVRELLQGDEPFALATVVEVPDRVPVGVGAGAVIVGDEMRAGGIFDPDLEEELVVEARKSLSGGVSDLRAVRDCRVFFEVLQPPPYLVICGAGDDARPLSRVATRAGFRAVLADPRSAYLERHRFPEAWRRVVCRPDDEEADLPSSPDTYVVVKTHNLARDLDWTRRFLETEVPYIGLLGPKERRVEILEKVDAEEQGRIFGPVGLDLGAEGPEQVALSIVSEVLAVRSGRRPRHLREREEPIHGPREREVAEHVGS